jgi:hypothetical protein
MDGIKLTGLTSVKENKRKDGKATLLVTFENLSGGALDSIGQENAHFIKGFSAMEITPPAGKGSLKDTLSPGQSIPFYWIMK